SPGGRQGQRKTRPQGAGAGGRGEDRRAEGTGRRGHLWRGRGKGAAGANGAAGERRRPGYIGVNSFRPRGFRPAETSSRPAPSRVHTLRRLAPRVLRAACQTLCRPRSPSASSSLREGSATKGGTKKMGRGVATFTRF